MVATEYLSSFRRDPLETFSTEDAVRILGDDDRAFNTDYSPVDFVFHGGSGSTIDEIREAIGYGVVKMNIDTDMQWAFLCGVRTYVEENSDYLQTQIGNPDGDEKPNKKYYDPRVWLRSGERSFVIRLRRAFEDLNCTNRNN